MNRHARTNCRPATRRRAAAVSLAVLVCVLPIATPATAHLRAGTVQPRNAAVWRDCGGSLTGLRCTTVPVPADWSQPAGTQIGLRVAKMTATDPGKPAPSVLIIPGGPGAGVDTIHALAPLLGIDQWTRNHDVYLFDPRGVGASSPVRCTLPDPDRAQVVTSEARFAALARTNRAFNDSCRAGTGELLRHLSSVDTAGDIEAIRLAIGQRDGLVAYSASYGTNYVGAYLERFGNHVRSLVMDGVVDHSRSLATFAALNARGVEDAFNRFTRWCDTDPACALHGQDVPSIFDQLVAKSTLPAPGAPRPATGSDVRSGTADLMSAGRLRIGWPVIATMLNKARNGDASGFVAQPTGSGVFRGVLCSDFGVPTSYAQVSARVARLRRDAPRFGEWKYWDVVAACVGHPHPPANPPHRLDVDRNHRVLVSSNTHDPATPLVNALAVRRQIPGAKLLTADADGHQAIGMSPCARHTFLRFFHHPAALPHVTRCPSAT